MEGVTRREFLRFLAASPLVGGASLSGLSLAGCSGLRPAGGEAAAAEPQNVFELEALARARLSEPAYLYAAGGADDELTLAANRSALQELQIRCRRLVDVSSVHTTTYVLGEELAAPIALAPVGFQEMFHPGAEIETARGAAAAGALMISSSVSSCAVGDIAAARGRPVWFQLYPTGERRITQGLLERAEAAGSRVVVLTVDTPVVGNRERHGDFLARMLAGGARADNYTGLRTTEPVFDPAMTWDMVDWLHRHCSMKVVLKGIVTHEDARRCIEHGADGILISNHGGRQEESNRGTIECLPEIVDAVGGLLPVMIDGGFRRGTDVLKALALGAKLVCVGRPYVWGLAAFGGEGVALALRILQAELVRAMQLAGCPSLDALDPSFVTRPGEARS